MCKFIHLSYLTNVGLQCKDKIHRYTVIKMKNDTKTKFDLIFTTKIKFLILTHLFTPRNGVGNSCILAHTEHTATLALTKIA